MCGVYHSIMWRPYNLVEELCVKCTTLSCVDLTTLWRNYVWSVPLYHVETLQPCGGIICEVYHSILCRPYNLVEELCVECTTLSCGDLTTLLRNYVWSAPLYPVETLQPCGGIMRGVYHSILWRPYSLVEELCVECTTLSCGDLITLWRNYV